MLAEDVAMLVCRTWSRGRSRRLCVDSAAVQQYGGKISAASLSVVDTTADQLTRVVAVTTLPTQTRAASHPYPALRTGNNVTINRSASFVLTSFS